jgi:hypothetical protein
MAEAVVGNLIDLAASGRRQLQSPVPMRGSETFQFELGRVDADLRAADLRLVRATTKNYNLPNSNARLNGGMVATIGPETKLKR